MFASPAILVGSGFSPQGSRVCLAPQQPKKVGDVLYSGMWQAKNSYIRAEETVYKKRYLFLLTLQLPQHLCHSVKVGRGQHRKL